MNRSFPRGLLTCSAAAVLVGLTTAVPVTAEPLHLYGYFSVRWEKVFDEPSRDKASGTTLKDSAPGEWSYPFAHVMLQHRLNDDFRVYANLNGGDFENVDIRNMWGEYKVSPALYLRVGKIYRKFGLYNEILDAVPSYFGIEPPELFDGDHLMISRTTTAMAHGSFDAGSDGILSYALTTDNGEGGPTEGSFPIGADLNYNFGFGKHTLGVSAYTSGGETSPDRGVGEGSPDSGVLPWMAADELNVFGGYFETSLSSFTFQGAFWTASHSATRDAESVVTVVDNADLHQAQIDRFLIDPAGAVDAANVRTRVDYDVQTWYLRAGWSKTTGHGEFLPYVQWDWYSNPETIASKTFGGDNEAGVADDGEFSKATLGLAYRPVPEVAVKLDGSSHIFEFNGKTESYPEVRFDVSYVFGQ